jgi:hypothetical protein
MSTPTLIDLIEAHKADIENYLAKKFLEHLRLWVTMKQTGVIPNAASTIAKKGSDTPYIDTGELMANIEVVGNRVQPVDGEHSSGFSYEELFHLLEWGSLDKHIPARRLFKKTLTYWESRGFTDALLKEYFRTSPIFSKFVVQ